MLGGLGQRHPRSCAARYRKGLVAILSNVEGGIKETYYDTAPIAKVLKLPDRTAGNALEDRALEFLRAVYETAEGSGAKPVEMKRPARRLGLERRVAENLTLRLQAQGLLRVVSMANGLLRLTPEGVRAIEDAGSGLPDPASRSGDGFADVQTPPVLDRAARRESEELFGPLKEALDRLDLAGALDGERRSELAAEIHTIEAQLDSPRPKRRIVALALESIKSIVGSETGGAVAERISCTIEAFLSDEAGRTARETGRSAGPPDRADQRGADDAAREPSTRGASQAMQGVADPADGAAGRTGQEARGTENVPRWAAGRATDRDDRAERIVGGAGGFAGSGGMFGKITDEAGRTVWRSVDESGDVVETVLNEDEEIVAEDVVGDVADLLMEGYVDEEGGIVSRERAEPEDDSETQPGEDESLHDPRILLGTQETGEISQRTQQIGGEQRQAEGQDSQDLDQRVRWQTVDGARDFHGGPMKQIEGRLQSDRAQLESLAGRIQEMIAAYSTVKNSLDEAAQDLGATDAVSQAAQQSREAADEQQTAQGETEQAEQDAPETRETADESGEVIGATPDDSGNPAQEDAAGAVEGVRRQDRSDQREAREPDSSREGVSEYAPVTRTENAEDEETTTSSGGDGSRERPDDALPEREYGGYAADRNGQTAGEEPDVLLDVPVLNVDEINLGLDEFRAHVSLRTEGPGEGVGQAVESSASGSQLLGKSINDAGQTTRRAVDESGDIVESTLNESGEVVAEEITTNVAYLPTEEEYVDDEGRIVSWARDESGKLVERLLDDEGSLTGVRVVGED